MRITYEATDPVIEFGPIEQSYWTTVWMDGPTAGHGGPSNAHADTGNPSAYRRTTQVGATMSLQFHGTAIRIYGVDGQYAALLTIDGRELGNFTVMGADSLLYGVSKLSERLHTFRIEIVEADSETSLLAINRVEIDTGLSDTFERVASYSGDSTVWEVSGAWEHRDEGAQGAMSIRSHARWEAATITNGLAGPSVVFLYGTVGPDYGLLQVMWTSNDTSPETSSSAHNTEATADSDVELLGTLIWTGVVPSQGWSRFQVQNLDGRERMVEITRLDVYAQPGSGVTSSGPPQASQSSVSNDSDSKSSSVSPAMVGGVVAGTVITLVAILGFFLVRRRRQRPLAVFTDLDVSPGATPFVSHAISELTVNHVAVGQTIHRPDPGRKPRGSGGERTEGAGHARTTLNDEPPVELNGGFRGSVHGDAQDSHGNILPAYTESPDITPLRL